MSPASEPPPAAAPEPGLARLRRRLAALGIVGVVMVALPLVQVLRFRDAELRALTTQQQVLDPMARAVQAQRSLVAHGGLASQVLGGHAELEPERRRQQDEVDQRVTGLSTTLAMTQLGLAIDETNALLDDWLVLSRRIGRREIDALASDQGHRLLLEQTLQVIDFIADFYTPRTQWDVGDGATAHALQLLLPALPRLTAQLLPVPAADPAGKQAGAPVRALAATLAHLRPRIDAATRHGTPDPTLDAAFAAAQAGVDRLLARLDEARPDAGAVQAARGDALQAQWQLFDAVQAAAAADLDVRIGAAAAQRDRLAGLTGLLALAALALLVALWRGLGVLQHAPPPDDTAPPPGQGGGRAEAGRLLQRLRTADTAAQPAAPTAARSDTTPSLPPEP